ncbi:hypothetical protein [Rhizobium sp. RAF56]
MALVFRIEIPGVDVQEIGQFLSEFLREPHHGEVAGLGCVSGGAV